MVNKMKMMYSTDRLDLRILTGDSAEDVLNFYQKNQEVFEMYEPTHPENFYTLNYQQSLLTCEYNLAVKASSIRFWVFNKLQPTHIIGTVAFHNIVQSIYKSCQIGYKFDQKHWKQGYAKESIAKAISIIFDELKLHRIEAFVMPSNSPSIQLLESLNFMEEGLCRENILIQDIWTDHLRYSLIHP